MKKLFCKHNHEIAIVGRDKSGNCIGCVRKDPTKDSRLKQFCPRNHNTFIVGRDKRTGCCNDCVRIIDKEQKIKHREKIKIRRKKYREVHQEEIRLKKQLWNEENKEHVLVYARTYLLEHKEERKAYNEIWHRENEDYFQQWAKDHPESRNATKIKQQANRNLRVVEWSDWDNIKKVYKNKPKGMAVDHYIPIMGESVAGLHVSWNLQYLTRSENSKKGNRINLLEASEWYGKILEEAGLK
jgi:hypothetical protein